uniref:Uncharacterized protein n=1 Tax=Strigamia maritima TaxID=126957 RepID=T1J0L4_STRMM
MRSFCELLSQSLRPLGINQLRSHISRLRMTSAATKYVQPIMTTAATKYVQPIMTTAATEDVQPSMEGTRSTQTHDIEFQFQGIRFPEYYFPEYVTKQLHCSLSLAIGWHIVQVLSFLELELHLPSSYKRVSNIIKWIGVHARSFKIEDYQPLDKHCLQMEFRRIQRVEGVVTLDRMTQLSRTYKITSGKWLFYVHFWDVDKIWRKVANKIATDEFGGYSTYAKVSTCAINEMHVICVHIKSEKTADIIQLEMAIRELGVKGKLYFKPDIYSFCGIHYGHPSLIRPVTFISDFRNGHEVSSVIRTGYHVR